MSFNQLQAGIYTPFTKPSSVTEQLPTGNYFIKVNEKNGFYLEACPSFTLPSKIYGDKKDFSDVFLNTMLTTREGKTTTALLSGLKGSGKTLTAKQVSLKAADLGISTLILTAPYSGSSFISFLQDVNKAGSFILFCDEFDKVYHKQEDLNSFLTILDGVASLNAVVLLTMNSKVDLEKEENPSNRLKKISYEFFHNRPGRAYFNLQFQSCTPSIIQEYCEENLNDKSLTQTVLNFCRNVSSMNLDILSVLVKELNVNYKGDFNNVIKYLNIQSHLNLKDYSCIHNELELGGLSLYLTDFLKEILGQQKTKIYIKIYEELYKLKDPSWFKQSCINVTHDDIKESGELGFWVTVDLKQPLKNNVYEVNIDMDKRELTFTIPYLDVNVKITHKESLINSSPLYL